MDLRKKPRNIFLPRRFTPIHPEVTMHIQEKSLDMRPLSAKQKQKKKILEEKKMRISGKKVLIGGLTSIFALSLIAGGNAIAQKKELLESGKRIADTLSFAAEKSTNGDFVLAFEAFKEIEKEVGNLRENFAPILLLSRNPNTSLPPAHDAIVVAEDIAKLGQKVTGMASLIQKIPASLLQDSGRIPLALVHELEESVVELKEITAHAQQTIKKTKTSSLIPKKEKQMLTFAQEKLPHVAEKLEVLENLFPAIYALSGEEIKHTTAVFFQNTGEIRASGGFMGSMAYLTGEYGKISGAFQDIYALSWKDSVQLPPAEGFERLATKMHLQDANFSPNFPTSAEMIRTKLKDTNSSAAETVVVIADELFFEILRHTGPIQVPGENAMISADNADMLLSFFVEAKASGKHTPKDIMKEMIPELSERVKALPPQTLLQIGETAIRNKWILAHSNNREVQHSFEKLGISGEIGKRASSAAAHREGDPEDFLAVFSANVGGNKSDRFLEESLLLSSAVSREGSAVNTLTITREHTWGKKQEERVERLLKRYGAYYLSAPLLREILGAGDNHSYTQVFVPKGSILLDAIGVPKEQILVKEEFEKTVFAFRFPKVSAGKQEEVQLVYALPEKIEENFHLQFQSQPGRGEVRISREILSEKGKELLGEVFESQNTMRDILFFAKFK